MAVSVVAKGSGGTGRSTGSGETANLEAVHDVPKVTPAPETVSPPGHVTRRLMPTAASPPLTRTRWYPEVYDWRTHRAQEPTAGEIRSPHVAADVAVAAGGDVPKTPAKALGTGRDGTVTRICFKAGSMLMQLPGAAAVPSGSGSESRQEAQAAGHPPSGVAMFSATSALASLIASVDVLFTERSAAAARAAASAAPRNRVERVRVRPRSTTVASSGITTSTTMRATNTATAPSLLRRAPGRVSTTSSWRPRSRGPGSRR